MLSVWFAGTQSTGNLAGVVTPTLREASSGDVGHGAGTMVKADRTVAACGSGLPVQLMEILSLG